ncbi:MAG: nucleotide exchange factor GrpE, partial [Clostridia bacterium]|nr:nucleotide exchange factor GrpE [Clostridia bacterium]
MENEELKQEPVEQKDEKKKRALPKKAQEEIDKALADAEESKRKWYAVTADYENYRRRTQNHAAQRYQDGRNDVIAALFPIGDNLERALAA